MFKFSLRVLALVAVLVAQSAMANDLKADQSLDEVQVWGNSLTSAEAGYTSPTSILLPQDMVSINAATTEDLVKYEPSLVIRRRFIGDSNGTLGMRGSNMFQTSRSMVFADGVPLHYFLQSRWNGAPRWTMVSASEIEKIEVKYGPFSAQYSGNSMGGVVLIETGIPQEQEFHFDINAFRQDFAAYGFDDQLDGYKAFASYGNKLGDLSYYVSVNKLDNDAQPQTFRGASQSGDGTIDVTGGIEGLDAQAREQLWYGDTGVVHSDTTNYKMKLGYDWGKWKSLLNVAFEDRSSQNQGESYIQDAAGHTLWSGENLIDDGYEFSFDSRRLNESILERESLSIGLRLKGDISQNSQVEINLNQFDILTDQSLSSVHHPNSSDYTLDGQINEYDDSGWQTAEVQLIQGVAAIKGLQVISGLRYEHYELNLNQYDSPNYTAATKGEVTSQFGGTTSLTAAFVQANWDINHRYDLAFGLRYELFDSADGYYSETDDVTGQSRLVYVPSIDAEEVSPKLSIGYKPHDLWQIRYSVAKAYRFPIVEELFRQYEAYNSINEANPGLQPEDGTHQNLMLERELAEGYVRINVFHEIVNNAIESQSTTLPSGASLSSFIPLDETRAQGVEFIYNRPNLFDRLDIRFNVTYTDAQIIENSANPEWEGNDYPRMPKWRSNLLTNFRMNDQWDIGATVQYASDSYGRIDNSDTVDNVYGAQDAYTRIGLKTNYRFAQHYSVSLGIDNLTNEIDYVAHPWPGRTLYLNGSFDF